MLPSLLLEYVTTEDYQIGSSLLHGARSTTRVDPPCAEKRGGIENSSRTALCCVALAGDRRDASSRGLCFRESGSPAIQGAGARVSCAEYPFKSCAFLGWR